MNKLVLFLSIMATSAFAQTREAPEYYLIMMSDISAAELFAKSCDLYDLAPVAMETYVQELDNLLAQDGFPDHNTAHTQMRQPFDHPVLDEAKRLVTKSINAKVSGEVWCDDAIKAFETQTPAGAMLEVAL